MAISFTKAKGSGSKGTEKFKPQLKDNRVRLVGGILPRYVYWVRGEKGDIPIECLAFNREEEKFNSKEKDHVPDYFPNLNCSWNYGIMCIDRADGKVKVFNLKKKLYEQISEAAEDLGDPADPDEGWDVVFTKKKTGSSNLNVEYTLKVLQCKKSPLTEEEKKKIAEEPTIDANYPLPTPEKVKQTLDKLTGREAEDPAEDPTVDKESVEDIPQ